MQYSKSIDVIRGEVVHKLNDFEVFKESVNYTSKLSSFSAVVTILSVVAIGYNLISTIITMLDGGIPFRYFQRIFFSSNGTDIIYYVTTMLGFGGLVIGGIGLVIAYIKKNRDFQKIYDHYTTNPQLESIRFAKYGRYYFQFKLPEELTMFERLVSTTELQQDNKMSRMMNDSNFATNLNPFNKKLKKEYGFSIGVHAVLPITNPYIHDYTDGSYRLDVVIKKSSSSIDVNKIYGNTPQIQDMSI